MLYENHKINSDYSDLTLKWLLERWAKVLNKPARARYLLSQSVKVVKGEKLGYLTGVAYLSPAVKAGGVNTCSHETIAKCGDPCLARSGQMSGKEAIEARADRLSLLTKDPALFFEILRREIWRLSARARRKNLVPVFRLNGTTDLDYTQIRFNGKTIFEHFPDLRFYDYTKNPNLAENYTNHGVHITFSFYKRAKTERLLELLDRGINIAIAYRDKLPDFQMIGGRKFEVINGDTHDLRFLDRRGVVVGLKYKNQTFHDQAAQVNRDAHKSGFIIFSNVEIN
jgi:hypothetical protein